MVTSPFDATAGLARDASPAVAGVRVRNASDCDWILVAARGSDPPRVVPRAAPARLLRVRGLRDRLCDRAELLLPSAVATLFVLEGVRVRGVKGGVDPLRGDAWIDVYDDLEALLDLQLPVALGQPQERALRRLRAGRAGLAGRGRLAWRPATTGVELAFVGRLPHCHAVVTARGELDDRNAALRMCAADTVFRLLSSEVRRFREVIERSGVVAGELELSNEARNDPEGERNGNQASTRG